MEKARNREARRRESSKRQTSCHDAHRPSAKRSWPNKQHALSNKQHALCTLGERSLTASAIGRPSNQQSRGPTNACHFVVVVGFSWMADVPSPIPVHAPRKAPKVASKYCAGVTPDFRSGVHRCCVQPINCRFRLSGVEPSGIPIDRSAPRFARK